MADLQKPNRDPNAAELRQLVDLVPQYMCVDAPDGTVLYANHRLLEFFGLRLEETQASDFRTRTFHPDDLERVRATREEAVSRGMPWEVETRLLRKDGQYRWFLIRFNPLRDEQGNVVRWYAAGTDIHDRKQAEAELRQLVDAVPQHIIVLDGQGQRLYANQAALDYHGYTLDHFLAVDHSECFHHDDLAAYDRLRENAIASGNSWEAEVRLRRRDGQYRWFLMRSNPLRDDQGRVIRFYLARTDIEDRKTAERALQRSNDFLTVYKQLVESSMDGILAFDREGRYIIWNTGMEKIFGIRKEERLGKHASELCPFFKLLDGTTQKNCYSAVLAGKGVIVSDNPYVFPDSGREIFLEGHFSPLRDCDDNVIGGLATIRDVTERKKSADALRQNEAYLAEAQALSHTGSYAHDLNRQIVYLSEEAHRIFVFDPTNTTVTYEDVRSRVHPEDVPIFEACSPNVIREREASTSDFRLLLPDGTIKHIHCVSRPVFDALGEVVEVVGTNMDVTEQRQANAALEKAFEEIKQLKEQLYRENLALKEEVDQASLFEEIVGSSTPLKRVLVQVSKVAAADSTVLITGETGTGKELIARAIHKRSPRASRAFVSVNCAAVPAALIGSELFGHEKGAFTGATQRRLGRFELAEGGTLFLDEVGDLPAETQIALLRVLQERQFERIGGNQPIAVNVRIIAATNRDLKAAINAGTFRNDLFYRLNVFPIEVPPLRDRKEDIPLLVAYITERYASKAGKKIRSIQRRTLELLQAYEWPGNVRELQNVVERAVILCDGDTLSVDEVWLQKEPSSRRHNGNGLARLDAENERRLIESALAESGGRVAGAAGAAARLGIPRSTLETKIRKLGIKKHRFHPD
jgi:PAS domain S-box-containing protein